MIIPDTARLNPSEFKHVEPLDRSDLANFTALSPGYLAGICEFIDDPKTIDVEGFPGEINCNFFKQKNGEISLYLSAPESSGNTSYLYLVHIPFTNKIGIILDTKNPEIALFSACTTTKDGLSAQFTRSGADFNVFISPTFAQTHAETTACFNNINNPTDLILIDKNNNTAHTTFNPLRNGNQGIFESGQAPFTVMLEGREVSIQTLVDSLKIQLAASDNLSPDEIDLRLISTTLNEESFKSSLEFSPPLPLLVETAIAPAKEKPPLRIQTNAEIAGQIFAEAQRTNQIEGNVISAIIDCQSESCPKIYKVNNLNDKRVQKLLSSIINNNYFNEEIENQVSNVLVPNLWEIILDFKNKFFKKPSELIFTKMDAQNFHLECSMVPYTKESYEGKTIICFTPSGDFYIVQGGPDDFSGMQTYLQRDYQIDPQGTNFMNLKEANLAKAPPQSFQSGDKTEIFVFPPNFRGDYSYDDLIFLSKELHANTNGYLLAENGDLIPTQIPYGSFGNYNTTTLNKERTGVTFYDISTGTTYVTVTMTDISRSDDQQQTFLIKMSELILASE